MRPARQRSFLLMLLFLSGGSLTHSPDLVFRHLTISEGLSQSVVNAIAQDQQGYIWFATEDGLNRYDGYTVTSYRNNPGENSSLADNYIWRLQCSRSGELLIGTFKGGLNIYHPSRDGFSSYRHAPDNTNSLSSDNVTAVLEDASGNLWIGTWFGGLNRLDSERRSGRYPSPQFVHYTADPNNPGTLSDNRVASIVEDTDGTLWIGTWNGLTRLDPETGGIRRYLHDPGDPSSLGGNKIWSMCLDTKGNLWVATWGGGLSCLDPAEEAFTTYRHNPADPGSLSSNLLRSVSVDSGGTVWVGTYDAGLNRLDENRKTFTRYLHDPLKPHSLPSNEIQSLYQDLSGILWVGTAGGASSFDPKRHKFQIFSPERTDPHSLSEGKVHAIHTDGTGGIWVGTLGGGLNYRPPGSDSFQHFRHNHSEPRSPSSDLVLCIAQKRGGDLWIGTRGGGLNSLDHVSGSFQRYRHDPTNPGSLALDDVSAVLETRSGTLWIGTDGGGLDRYDPTKGEFVHYRHDPEDSTTVSGHHIWSLFEDSRGSLWIGTWGADLSRYDPETGTFVRYRHNPADTASLSSNTVLCMAEDSEGILWFGTQDGLNRFDQTSFRQITERDGLPNNTVFGILPDDAGNLWLSTGSGLTRFNPRVGTFRNFDQHDGLQGNAFNKGAYARDTRGWMYFGGNNGFNAFHPDSIRDNPRTPPVVITQFKVFGKPFRLAPTRPLSITLDHDQLFFSIEYAALDYSIPEKNKYEYRMEGIDRDWVFADTRRYVSYSHLNGGTYRFQVRGSNGDGVWNETGTSLIITIVPPFWDMWWFKTLAGLAGLLALWTLYRYRLRKLVEIERMRVRIASDLHDEVGSSLTKIALYSDLLKDNPDRSSTTDFAGKIGEMSRSTVTTMSDIVWSIDARNDTIGDLVDRMRDTASSVLAAQHMETDFQIEGLEFHAKLSVDLRENLFLIFKEAITNAAKYSGGSRVAVRLSNRGGSFLMDIRDNGKGFSGRNRRGGQGLRNMEMRAKRIRGTLTVSEEGGVRIRLVRAPL